MIVNIILTLVQFPTVAVTLIVLVMGALVALKAVKAGRLPVPDVGAKPMDSGVRDQLMVAPGTLAVKTVEGTDVPSTTDILATCAMLIKVVVANTSKSLSVATTEVPMHIVPPDAGVPPPAALP